MKIGYRSLVAVNEGRATLQIARSKADPTRVVFVLFQAPMDVVESGRGKQVATWWMPADSMGMLKSSL